MSRPNGTNLFRTNASDAYLSGANLAQAWLYEMVFELPALRRRAGRHLYANRGQVTRCYMMENTDANSLGAALLDRSDGLRNIAETLNKSELPFMCMKYEQEEATKHPVPRGQVRETTLWTKQDQHQSVS